MDNGHHKKIMFSLSDMYPKLGAFISIYQITKKVCLQHINSIFYFRADQLHSSRLFFSDDRLYLAAYKRFHFSLKLNCDEQVLNMSLCLNDSFNTCINYNYLCFVIKRLDFKQIYIYVFMYLCMYIVCTNMIKNYCASF